VADRIDSPYGKRAAGAQAEKETQEKGIKMKALKIIALVAIGFFSVASAEEPVEPGFNEATFKGLEFRSIGPAFMSGRIADIAIDPTDPSVWYVAVGSGGVWKTENASTTWTPIFDDQGSYSIGCVTLDPNNPNTVWVGTGENVSGRHVGYGDGVYRSRDGGASWENMGLENRSRPLQIYGRWQKLAQGAGRRTRQFRS
jgi:hypothetical protein